MKKIKRVLSMLLVCCLVVGLLPATAVAYSDTDIAYAVEGGNIYFDKATGTVTDCDKGVTIAEIPNKIDEVDVTSIGQRSFYNCDDLNRVVIPDGVITIGQSAFYDCDQLKEVEIPDSVVNIEGFAFYRCELLTHITIPEGVATIGEEAFYGCDGLTEITVPASVSEIGDEAFGSCNGLTHIYVDDNNISYTSVDGVLFNNDITSIICYPAGKQDNFYQIPDSIILIGRYAFEDCYSLTSVSIPYGVSSIGASAFYGCTNLFSIVIPDSVTTIERYAFTDTGLTSVVIPSSVTSLGDDVFAYCSKLTTAGPIGGGYDYEFGWTEEIPSNAFEKCDGLVRVQIPDSVTSIGADAFQGCEKLSEISIPDGVVTIGMSAFRYCNSLQNIELPFGLTFIDSYAFESSGLTSITIPSTVTTVGKSTFCSCGKLSTVNISANINSIEISMFHGCYALTNITIPDSVTSVEGFAFYLCSGLTDVYYSGSVEQWEAISFEDYNTYLTDATIHYNSTGPDDIASDDMNPVYFLSDWDSSNRQVKFGDTERISPITYTVAGNITADISSLLDKYVLATLEQGDSILEYTITDIQPVESATGTVSATGEHSLTIDGTEYPVREDYILGSYDGQEILYHTYNGTIMGFTELEEKTGTLETWDSSTGQATIDGAVYPTNYLSDLPERIDQLVGKKVEFSVAALSSYNPVLKLSFCPGFYFSTNAVTSCIEAGTTFDLYVGYYCEDGSLDSRSKNFISVVSNENIIDATPDSWDDTYGQHYTITAQKAGSATLTVTNPRNSDAASLNLYVIEKEAGYSFDNVPKLTYEDGKTTNFYNYNGMVVDEFAYTPHKDENGEIDYYTVTMTVYNSLDLYGAVTAFDAEGNPKGFYIIDKREALPSNFVNTVKELILETGDLFYLIGNSHYYSGESITKKTEVSIEVPVGGYIEISNSLYSDIALCANVISLVIDGLSTAKDIVDDTADFDGLIAEKPAIISEIISEDYVGKKLTGVFKDAAINELKNGNWNYDNYGECLQAFLDHLSESGIDLMETISKKIVSVTGIASITESVVMKIIPTGNLINFLYDLMGIGDQAVAWVTFQKSADFSTGIYIYAPSTGNSYRSNGISVISATTTESNVVIHSYLVVDPYEVKITNSTFPNEQTYLEHNYETYSITMYKDGQETQPDSTVTVRIPLSDTFQSLDAAKVKVYRINDNGTVTDMSATVIDGYAVFTTSHFSYYAVVYEDETAVSGVSLQRDNITLTQITATEMLTATITPDNATNQSVTWSSSDEAVATVDGNGLVTAVGAGTAIITVATADGGFTATCAVTVYDSTTLTISPAYADIYSAAVRADPEDASLSLTVMALADTGADAVLQAYLAEYDDDGRLTGLSVLPCQVTEDGFLFSGEVPENACKLFLLDGDWRPVTEAYVGK